MNRKIEKILAIVGAVLGFIGILMIMPEFLIAVFVGASIFTAILALLILSGAVLGLVGAFRINKRPKLSGGFLVIAAMIETLPIFLNYFLAALSVNSLAYVNLIVLYIVPAIFMLVAGIICLIKKNK